MSHARRQSAAWLDSVWPFVAVSLPKAPAIVIDIGCGPFGGFVPRLREAGYQATGVDPNAPAEPGYVQSEFEQFRPPAPADAIIASLSLHHVADPSEAARKAADLLRPAGPIVVIEWARESFDERTARWAFARLPTPATEDDAGWLHYHRDAWPESGKNWTAYLNDWAQEDGLHQAADVIAALDQHFQRTSYATAGYFATQLDGVTEAGEQAAIAAGEIAAVGVRYTGVPNTSVSNAGVSYAGTRNAGTRSAKPGSPA